MTTQFPSSLDNFNNPTPSDSLNTPGVVHSDQHANANDAIEAIEAWVGTSGTNAQASHEYRIKTLENAPAGNGAFGVVAQDEGVFLGTGAILNFVGQNVEATISGTVIRIFVTGSSGGGQAVVFPQDNIGIFGQDEGQPLGTGTAFNVVGDDVSLSISGTTLTLVHTNPIINFPQEVIGIMGWDKGVPLGTGTILDTRGNIGLSISGTVLNLFVPYPVYPQSSIGIYGQDEAVGLGTGTILNVVGSNIAMSLSGTVLTIQHTDTPIPAVIFPQEVIGVMGQDEGVPLGTGTTLNVVGSNIALSLSGTVLQLTHTDTPVTFPQEVIGIYGQDEGVNLGTGSVLNVIGNNIALSLSGSVLQLVHTDTPVVFPQELIGIMGWDEGVPLGTGVVLDVVGSSVTLTRSGTVLTLTHINPAFPQDNIGFFAENKGIPLGTGTILNVNGSRLVASLSGTTLDLSNSPDPQELIGVMGWNNGIPLSTGLVLNVNGSRLVLTASGTVLNLSNSPDQQELIGVYAWSNGVPVGTGTIINFVGTNVDASISGSVIRVFITGTAGTPGAPGTNGAFGVFAKNNGTNLGTGTTIDFGAELNAAITGTTIFVHPFDGGVNGDAWIKITGSVQQAGWVDQDYNIQWFLGDGSNVVSTGSISAGYPYVDVPVDSIIESWSVVADATGSIVVDILKSTYAAFPPTSPIAGLGQPVLSSRRTNNANATGTVSVLKTDQILLSVSSASTVKNVTVSLRCKKNATA